MGNFRSKLIKNWNFWGNREIRGKIKSYHVSIIKIHVLAKFHEEMMIFEEVGGHLVISTILQGSDQSYFRKKAIEFEVDLLDTPNFYKIHIF